MAQDQSVDVVGELADATTVLNDARARVEAANAELRNRIVGARELAKLSRVRLDQVRGHWDGESTAVRNRLVRTRETAEGTLGALDDALGDLAERADTLEDLLSSTEERITALASDVGTRAQEGQDSISEQLEAVDQAFAAVEKAAALFVSEGDRSVKGVEDELSTWVTNAQAHSQKLVAALAALGTHGSSRSADLASALDAATSAKLTDLGEALLTGAIGALTSSGGEARQALNALGLDNDGAQGNLQEDIGEVLDRVQEVLDVIERVRPLLESIQSLLR